MQILYLAGMNVTRSYYLDQRRPLKDGTFPLKLEVYDGVTQRYYKVSLNNKKLSFTLAEWKAINSKRKKAELQTIRDQLAAMLSKAGQLIDSMPVFDHDEFKQRWERPLSDRTNVFTWFAERVRSAKNESTRDWYLNASKSFRKYAGKDRVHLQEINLAWLKRYEQWIREQGRATTTAYIYITALRAVYNDAIQARAIDRDKYPFGRRSFQIPIPRNPKRALSAENLQTIMDYEHDDPFGLEMWARDIFVFSILFNGLGPADIFRLRWEHVDNWQCVVDRQKTKGRRRRSAKAIHVRLSEQAQAIMLKWSNSDRRGFVFAVLEDKMNEAERRRAIKNETRRMNRQLSYIIPGLSMMAARHTFAEMLSSSGVDMRRIQQALGHGDLRTTENYLGAFADQEAKDISDRISEQLGGRASDE